MLLPALKITFMNLIRTPATFQFFFFFFPMDVLLEIVAVALHKNHMNWNIFACIVLLQVLQILLFILPGKKICLKLQGKIIIQLACHSPNVHWLQHRCLCVYDSTNFQFLEKLNYNIIFFYSITTCEYNFIIQQRLRPQLLPELV